MRTGVPSSVFTIPNPLPDREPDLFGRMSAFRERANDLLLDALAAKALGDPLFRADARPHPVEEVRATALILRMLTKESWDRDDMAIFDVCWRAATRSELFGDEFEAERHTIENGVRLARSTVPSCDRSRW